MQAIILGGGEGIKLRPLTFSTPKPLLPLINKPIIDYIILILKNAGVTNIILTVDYKSTEISNYFSKNDFGIPIKIHKIENFNGTAQILKDLEPQLEDNFFVVPADCIYDLNLKEALQFFQNQNALLGLVVRKEKDILGKGGLAIKNNFLAKIINQSEYNDLVFSDAWVYYFQKQVLSLIEDNKYTDIHLDFIQKALDKNISISTYQIDKFWAVIGRVHTYIAANFWILQNIGTDSYIGANSIIDPSAKLIPPFFIDEECKVGKNVALGPNAILCKNVTIKNNVSVDNSIIHRRTNIEDNCKLENCIVSDSCYLEKNTTIGRFAIVAANCHLGESSKIEDGARIGPNLKIEAHSQIDDFIFPAIFQKQKLENKSYSKGLSPDELEICLKLQDAGEQTLEGIVSSANIEKDALENILNNLIEKKIITSYGDNPRIYSIL
ncbi:sugar phosphate nucleotidyltransferase [Candidatus Margulisiibacteriota bacterium]